MRPTASAPGTTQALAPNTKRDCYSARVLIRAQPWGTGCANLKGRLVKEGELRLINAHIGEYEHGNIFNHEPVRARKLLVHKSELYKLMGKTQQKGLTLIPTRLYFKNGRVKVELVLARGRQMWDKRETERRRTADKEAREAIARNRRS